MTKIKQGIGCLVPTAALFFRLFIILTPFFFLFTPAGPKTKSRLWQQENDKRVLDFFSPPQEAKPLAPQEPRHPLKRQPEVALASLTCGWIPPIYFLDR